MCQLLTVTWPVSGRLRLQILQSFMTNSFAFHTLTLPVPDPTQEISGLEGMAETTGGLPVSILCFFVKSELILAENMVVQQTDCISQPPLYIDHMTAFWPMRYKQTCQVELLEAMLLFGLLSS